VSRRHKPREEVFAVIRVDSASDSPENQITVKEIVRSRELAEAEVSRLTRLNASKGCLYFWQTTRLFGPGEAAGSTAD
jgi:hypothetical protein